jgi:predicted porin
MKHGLLMAGILVAATNVAYSAESEVTVYGIVDAGIASTHVSGPDGAKSSVTGVVSGGLTDSLFGIKGQEKLSGDLSATFQLESLFDAATGHLSDKDSFFSHAAWVGLNSQHLGELRLGRQHTIAQQFGSQLEIASWKEMGMGATFKSSDNYRVSNAVNYISPSLSGFSFGAGYSFDVTGTQINGQKSPMVSAALQYSQGPLLLVATWDKAYLSSTVLPGGKNPEAWQLGASYDFQVAKLSVAWSRMKNGYAGLDGGDPSGLGLGLGAAEFANGGQEDAYLLGLAVPVSAHGTVLAQWSYVKPGWHWQDGTKARAGQVATLGYVHTLSPRTTLYAMAGLATRYSLEDQVVRGQGTTTRYMAGINHKF